MWLVSLRNGRRCRRRASESFGSLPFEKPQPRGCARDSAAVTTAPEVVVAERRASEGDVFPPSLEDTNMEDCARDSAAVTIAQGADVAGRQALEGDVFFPSSENATVSGCAGGSAAVTIAQEDATAGGCAY